MAEVMTTMRAMRRLRPDPVPDELVRELIEAAMYAPSAGHQVDMYEGWMGKGTHRRRGATFRILFEGLNRRGGTGSLGSEMGVH